ncbi:MAG: serine hydrolase [Microbacteriaceae bacterium]
MPLTRRQIYRRRRATVIGSVALVLGVLAYLPMTLLAPVEQVAAAEAPYTAPVPAPTELDFPDYGASAIAVVDDDGMLGTGGSEEPLPMASITKVITALVVLDANPLAGDEAGPSVTMTPADVASHDAFAAVGGSVVPVQSGWQFSQRDLVELTVVRSANNYATSLAHWAFGDDAGFVAATDAWLAEQGLENTTLVEPTGLSDDNRATASDLIELGRIALADPLISSIVNVRSIEVPHLGEMPATNRMLGELGIDGIKTGTLYDIVNLLFSSTFEVGGETVSVVGVILGAPGPDRGILNTDVLDLLRTTQAGFSEVVLVSAGEEFGSYSTEWGQSTTAVADRDVRVPMWHTDTIDATIELDRIGVAEAGSAAGEAVFTVGEKTVSTPLVLTGAITDPGPGWRLTNPFTLLG